VFRTAFARIRARLDAEGFAAAAMFELAELGHRSVFEQLVACVISIRTRDEVMLPTALAYIVVVASVVLGLDALGLTRGSWPYLLAMLGLNLVLLVVLFVVLDRGRIISPATTRLDVEGLSRLRAQAVRRNTLAPGKIR